MDDAVILEPSVGLRPWLNAACLEESMRAIGGKEAINDDKNDGDGVLRPQQLIWGINMDFNKKTVSLPEQKCMKAQHLLALPELRYGSRQIPKKLA